jgi:solute carrier family 13 (sodium-dependent dicarboxylate transporter), member 2/3/5
MVLICLLIVLGGWDEKNVLGVLGLDVIWLNIGAFILCSVLVVTGVAKRVAIMLILKYRQNGHDPRYLRFSCSCSWFWLP